MADNVKKIPILEVLKQTYISIIENKVSFALFSLLNLLFLACFAKIDGGLSNRISILWICAYYVYWCVFFRFYYNKKPYLFTLDIFGSLIPSTKMFFLVIAMSLLLGVLPYLPLLMGFDDKYLLLFEAYMQQLQATPANMINMAVLSVVLILISPFIFCRPFLAFIASVQGLNGSLKKAWKKSVGNYLNFVVIMFLLNVPYLAVHAVDKYFEFNNILNLIFLSFFFVFYNIFFAKLYDFFYTE